MCILNFYPFLTKCILLEKFLVCLVFLPLLDLHIADILSKTIKGASSGTMSGSVFKNSWINIMKLAHFRMLIHEFLNTDPYIFPDESPLIILYSKSDMCMTDNITDTKHTRNITRRMKFARNDEKCKMHKIYWCERGLQLAYILPRMLVSMI